MDIRASNIEQACEGRNSTTSTNRPTNDFPRESDIDEDSMLYQTKEKYVTPNKCPKGPKTNRRDNSSRCTQNGLSNPFETYVNYDLNRLTPSQFKNSVRNSAHRPMCNRDVNTPETSDCAN